MNEFSREDRELVRSELEWLAEFLHEKVGLPIKRVKRLIREMLDVTL